MAGDGSTEDVGKIALVPPKAEKGELSMGLMVTIGWESKDYLAPIEESVLLVGKSMGMPETTSGGFVPQIVGVGQMKLEGHHDTPAKGNQGHEFGSPRWRDI